MRSLNLMAVAFILAAAPPVSAADYGPGVFFVNEDWYGHNNSSVNFLRPDDADGNYWDYRVFSAANAGRELGCTAQFGAIHQGRFYIICKQDRDPGSTTAGGRITVADARSMEMLYQSALIDPSGQQCDGRGFVGVDAHKAYISSSHGVWPFDLDTYTVADACVAGTENPAGHGTGGNTDTGGALYHGQCGTMVLAAGKVFVAHQSRGLLRIDPATDTVDGTVDIDALSGHEGAGPGSVVAAADGMLYVSVCADCGGMGEMLPCLLRIDPQSLEGEKIELPEGIYPPASSWYAWTPDAFCASTRSRVLYWNGGENSWFSTGSIFRYDIDGDTFEKTIDLEADGEGWKLYGCSLRVHPESDELYMSLFREFGSDIFMVRRTDASGTLIRDYDMVNGYWFPSIPVFSLAGGSGASAPSAPLPGISVEAGGTVAVSCAEGLELVVYGLQGQELRRYGIGSDYERFSLQLSAGMYVARVGRRTLKFSI